MLQSIRRTYLKKIYKKYIPLRIKNIVYRYRWKIKQNSKVLDLKIKRLSTSDRPIRVLFIISNIPMWRAQYLYDLLKTDSRFDPKIIVSTFQRYNQDEQAKYITQIVTYLSDRGINDYIIADSNLNIEKFMNEDFNPDIVFPSQYYNNVYGNKLDLEWNTSRIYCHIPYALITINNQFAYNYKYHNTCWKFYVPTTLHYRTAKRVMANKGKNVVVVGEPDYDLFMNNGIDPWKKLTDGKKRKRIIWAPHFAITNTGLLNRASFLWLFDHMLNLAIEYKETVQFAFKPHPHLYNTLCQLEGWGKEKTDAYYDKWISMDNTQLEEGDFIDLFKYSDAMIHDCGSFTGEYMYVNKPVMFTTKNPNIIRKGADEFGLKCIDLHYIGKNVDEVKSFIEETVLNEADTMASARKKLYSEYLLPPNGHSVAENIYKDIVKSFRFNSN